MGAIIVFGKQENVLTENIDKFKSLRYDKN